MGASIGQDVMGEDTHPGDLTLVSPVLSGVWNGNRSRQLVGGGSSLSIFRGGTSDD